MSPPPKTQSQRKRERQRRKALGADGEEENVGWTTVINPKDRKQPVTEEERREKQQMAVLKRSLQVQTTESQEYNLTVESLGSHALFSPSECEWLEEQIDQVVVDAQRGLFKERTVDLTPMRNKYFFGFAYTYGAQKDFPGAKGIEAVWPPEETSEIPVWIREKIVSRLEARRIVPKGWINSATINDYSPGGCIVSHIDPPHLFDRPIVSVSFFSDCNLVFGTKFAFPREARDPETSTPVHVQRCQRGHATVLKGYSANNITHAIRPCDLPSRRSSIILRRVKDCAPVLSRGAVVPLREHLSRGSK